MSGGHQLHIAELALLALLDEPGILAYASGKAKGHRGVRRLGHGPVSLWHASRARVAR